MLARLSGFAVTLAFQVGAALADEPATLSGIITVPAGTLVMLRMEEGISSQTSKAGDVFHFNVDEPVVVAANVVIPRGARGFGEVLHAEKASGTKQGELVAVARSISVSGREVPLRTFVAGSANRDVDVLGMVLYQTSSGPVSFGANANQYHAGMKMVLGVGGLASARTAKMMELPGTPANDGAMESGHDTLAEIDHATVVFFRQRKPESHPTAYRVFEGEVLLGTLPTGTWISVPATPGRHNYRLGPRGDADVVLEVSTGENYYVIARVGGPAAVELAASNQRSFETLRTNDPLKERAAHVKTSTK